MSKFSRQESIIDTGIITSEHPLLVGCGAVGYVVADTLVRNGVNRITICDFDEVEEHNCVTQGFYNEDIGRPKVECLADQLMRINPDVTVIVVNDRWRPKQMDKLQEENGNFTALFACVDDMTIRRKLFEYYYPEEAESRKVPFMFDCRIGGEQIRTLSVYDDESYQAYDRSLNYGNDGAFEVGCHVPMIKHSANIGASHLVQQYIAGLKKSLMFADRIYNLPSSDLYEMSEETSE